MSGPLPPAGKNKALIAALLFVCLMVAILIGLILFFKKPALTHPHTVQTVSSLPSQPAQKHPDQSPRAQPKGATPALLFESFGSDTPGSPTEKFLTDTTGAVVKQFTTAQTDVLYDLFASNLYGYVSYSRGALSSDEIYPTTGPVQVTKYALLTPDGSILSFPQALLDRMQSSQLSDIFIAPGNTLLALLRSQPATAEPFRYSSFDITTGNETVLLNVSAANSRYFPHFLPEDISMSGNTITFLVSDVTINSHTVNGTATVVYNLATHTMTIQTLPDPVAALAQSNSSDQYPYAVQPIGVSPDGNTLVYQSTQTQTTKAGGPVWSTHLYKRAIQKDMSVQTDIVLPGGYNSFFFSPDGTYFVIYFANAMDIVRVSDGVVVKRFNLGNEDPNNSPHSSNIQPVGWIDNTTLAYLTETTDSPGNFNTDHASSHIINVETQKISDFPPTLGRLTAILYR